MSDHLLLATLLSSLLLSHSLIAATDGGLIADGTAGTLVAETGAIFEITGGTVQGTNVLHSFQEFNLETDEIADFQPASDTRNIISRVTGPNDSWIDGKIRSTTEGTNLYLINPNGIIMGRNASLDVLGAFHASTADYVTLENGQRIYTDLSRDGVTLTVADPKAFGFLDNSVGQIQLTGSELTSSWGGTISLVGGEITLTSTAILAAPGGGHINLIGVAAAGEVQPVSEGIHNTITTRADITLTNSIVTVNNTENATAGNIWLEAHDIQLTEGARIKASTSGPGQGGTVSLNADNLIHLSGNGTTIQTSTEGPGNAGNILIGQTVRPTHLRLANGATIASNSNLRGAGEEIEEGITAGKAGNLTILTGKTVELSGGSALTTASENADSGDIRIKTRDQLSLLDSRISTSVTGGNGQGGNIFIDPVFVVLGNSRIQANAYGGPGGNITVIGRYLIQSDSVIEAESTLSTPGTIDLQIGSPEPELPPPTPDPDLSGQINKPKEGAIVQFQFTVYNNPQDDMMQRLPLPCHLRRGNISHLIMAGYDAHPTAVDDMLSSLPLYTLLSSAPSDAAIRPPFLPRQQPMPTVSPMHQYPCNRP